MLPLFALVAPTEGLRWVERGLASCDEGTPPELSRDSSAAVQRSQSHSPTPI